MKTITEKDQQYICDIDVPCFRAMSAEERELIQLSRTQVIFRKGDHLTKQGVFSSYVLFLISGLVKQYVEDDTNRVYNIRFIMPGDFAGLSVVFGSNMYSYSAVAITDCQAFLVEKESLIKVANGNAGFTNGIVKRYFDAHMNLFEKIRQLVFKQMAGRLATALLYLHSVQQEYPTLFTLLSRKDVADFAGISTESTVKLLKQFEKDGWLKLQEKEIQILQPDSLRLLSERG